MSTEMRDGRPVRTYRGRSLEELIPKIRAELGPDAIILREREGLTGGFNGFFQQRCVEVDAQAAPAVDFYDEEDAALPDDALDDESAPTPTPRATTEFADAGGADRRAERSRRPDGSRLAPVSRSRAARRRRRPSARRSPGPASRLPPTPTPSPTPDARPEPRGAARWPPSRAPSPRRRPGARARRPAASEPRERPAPRPRRPQPRAVASTEPAAPPEELSFAQRLAQARAGARGRALGSPSPSPRIREPVPSPPRRPRRSSTPRGNLRVVDARRPGPR